MFGLLLFLFLCLVGNVKLAIVITLLWMIIDTIVAVVIMLITSAMILFGREDLSEYDIRMTLIDVFLMAGLKITGLLAIYNAMKEEYFVIGLVVFVCVELFSLSFNIRHAKWKFNL